MTMSNVNAAMYVRFEADSDVIISARIAVGGMLSSAAVTYDLTELMSSRFVATTALCSLNLIHVYARNLFSL